MLSMNEKKKKSIDRLTINGQKEKKIERKKKITPETDDIHK